MQNHILYLWLRARDRVDWQRSRLPKAGARFLEPISALLLIIIVANATMTGVQLGDAAYKYVERSEFADEIAAMPQTWADSVRERRLSGSLSGYRAELEIQLIQELRAQADPLAERVRAMGDEEWQSFLGSQAFQQALGLVGGQCVGGVFCSSLGQQAGQVAGEAAKNVVDFGWNAQDAALRSAKAGLEVDLEAKRGLVKLEMERLLGQQLDDWETAEPLLEARLCHRIRHIELHLDQWSDEELVEESQALAIKIDQVSGITRAGGSEDSPFADYKALANWLVAKARPDAAVDEEESPQFEFDVTDWFPKDEREQFCHTVIEPVLPADSHLLAYVTQFTQGCMYSSCDAEGNCTPATVGITPYASDAQAQHMFEGCREGGDYADYQAGLEGHRVEFTDNRMIDIRTLPEGLVNVRVTELYGNVLVVLEHRNLPGYSLATIDALAEVVHAQIDTRRTATRIGP